MEWKIGEIKQVNCEWYQCVESQDGSCKHCDMNFEGKCPIPIKECTESGRSDKSYVIFKKLEKIGEPYERFLASNHSIKVQRYRLPYRYAILLTEPIMILEPNYKNSIEIQIKQNEDMDENKLNLKPFSLEAAKAGKPVCTRDGRKARIICFDYNGETGYYPIVALVHYNKGNKCYERVLKYTYDGMFNIYGDCQHDEDLMMLPEKKEGWVNVYKMENEYICENECNVSTGIAVYKSEGEAKRNRDKNEIYVNTIKITWEE